MAFSWPLVCRLTQIVFGLIALGFSIALQSSLWYNISLLWAGIYLSGGIVLLGVFGLFGTKKRPENKSEGQLYLLILFIDVWAIVLCIADGTCLAVSISQWSYEPWDGEGGLILAPCILSYACVFTILPCIVQTLRWKRMLSSAPPVHPAQGQYNMAYVQPCEHVPPYHYETAYCAPQPTLMPHYVNDVKNNYSSRPISDVESMTSGGETTLRYSNIASATQVGQTPSYGAPPYTRVPVGSKA